MSEQRGGVETKALCCGDFYSSFQK